MQAYARIHSEYRGKYYSIDGINDIIPQRLAYAPKDDLYLDQFVSVPRLSCVICIGRKRSASRIDDIVIAENERGLRCTVQDRNRCR
jgi:hypothetical protein